jgi:hypothetical protein
MMVPELNEKELNVLFEVPDYVGGGPSVPIYSYTIAPMEACRLLFQRKPVWQSFRIPLIRMLLKPSSEKRPAPMQIDLAGLINRPCGKCMPTGC